MQELDVETLGWVEAQVDMAVVSSERLIGGRSGEVFGCSMDDSSALVVRRMSDNKRLQSEPDLMRYEVTALELLAEVAIPTPEVIATDVTAGRFAMTLLPGEMVLDARALQPRVEAIAELAACIADVPIPAALGLPSWKSWVSNDPVPPEWGDRRLWEEGIRTYKAQNPETVEQPVLLHRDLHPGNLLWRGHDLTGVVDWVNACVGHPHAELGHCRWNLSVLVGPRAGDEFLSAYLAVTGGGPYNHWWDLSCALSFLPGPIDPSAWVESGRNDLTEHAVIAATESFLRAALRNSVSGPDIGM